MVAQLTGIGLTPGARTRRVRRPGARVLWAAAGVVVMGWVAALTFTLLAAARHITAGESAAAAAQSGVGPSTITRPSTGDVLEPVQADFAAARSDLDSPVLVPVKALPLLGRQLHAVRSLAAAAEQVAVIGRSTVRQARAALKAPHTRGPDRLAAIRSLADAASRADVRLAQVSLGPADHLLSYVRDRHNEFARRLARLRQGIHRGAVAAHAVAGLLGGPDRMLLLAANNAEMRNASGMFLSATTIDFHDGDVSTGTFRDTSQLMLPPDAVPLTGGLAARWGFLGPNQEWRNLGLSARFDATAALAARMWKARTGQDVNGVMVLDIEAVHTLLQATGPVQADGQTVSPATVVQYLLHDQYRMAGAHNQARRERLGAIAGAVLGAIQAGHYDPSLLTARLSGLVAGRHLLLWSSDARSERAWTSVGVAGSLTADTLLVAVQNRGANKLDQFLTVSTDLSVAPGVPGPEQTSVVARIELRNTTPAGQPAYIAGGTVKGLPAGAYLGYVTVTMPYTARGVTVDGRPGGDVSGPDGPTQVVAVLRMVPRGGSIDVTVGFTIPAGHGHMQVVSAARIPAATYSLEGRAPSAPIPDEKRPSFQW